MHSSDKQPPNKRGISRQLVLPYRTSIEISFKNLRVRFFRSMITISSLILAVSFLSFVLINLDLARGIVASGGKDAASLLLGSGFDVDLETLSVVVGPKDRWIVLLSLVVCTVGIINAQLMSVTERFREIGIMKCLGALDSIVLRLFLLEAGMQGLAGAGLGAELGFVFAMLTSLIKYGFIAWTSLSYTDALLSVLLSVGAGCVLSLIGVLYPAIVAARMRPVVAMKTEL